MTDLIAVIDAGTTSVRSALVGEHGAVAVQHAVSTPIAHPELGAAEQDVDVMWDAVAATLSTVCDQRPPDSNIVAVNTSAQRASIAVADAHGKPLTPFLLWMDLRGGHVLDDLEVVGRDRFTAVTGTPFGAMPGVTRLLWLRREHPGIFDQAARVIGVADSITARLIGQPSPMDLTCAAWTGLLDIGAAQWSTELAGELGIDHQILPDLTWASKPVGVLSPEAAAETGLPAGVPVLPGAGDQQCSSSGAGAITPGTGSINLGTSATYVAPVTNGAPVATGMVRGAHVMPGLEDREGTIPSCGSALRWVAQTFGYGDTDAGYSQLTAEAAEISAGSDGLRFDALFAGGGTPDWSPRVASITDLELRHGRAHVARAVIESIGAQLRHLVDTLDTVNQGVDLVTAVGGGARSPALCQILADTSRQPLLVPPGDPQQSALRGAAAIAWSALGMAPGDAGSGGTTFGPSTTTRTPADEVYGHHRAAASSPTPERTIL